MEEKKAYDELRRQYPVFRYKSYSLWGDMENIYISYGFEIEGLTSFEPKIRIGRSGLKELNPFDSAAGRRIVFLLGMVEAVSYLKAACCPVMRVECGFLDEDEKLWWKKLYFGGLGEFFFRNGINADFETFLSIDARGEKYTPSHEGKVIKGSCLVPVGGGKDSAVTAELLKRKSRDVKFFTVNDQPARTETVVAAGYREDDIIKTYRTISPELLELNSRGFLNGHTPFSAIVAFLSLYCAYITGRENIVLSNESSANESNIKGLEVNHQYSKSYEFERDFNAYAGGKIFGGIRYFSLLRPFNELQIGAYFCKTEKYLKVFRSCNAGSKKNIWCCSCPKCLFVYCMLSPFLPPEKLLEIFGQELLDKEGLTADFDGLTGRSELKPFECVGTAAEVNYALAAAIKRFYSHGRPLPLLLRRFEDSFNGEEILKTHLLREFNRVHNVPDGFLEDIKEMYRYVSEKSY